MKRVQWDGRTIPSSESIGNVNKVKHWVMIWFYSVPDGVYYAKTLVEAPYNEVNEKCSAILPELSPCCSACH